MSLLLVGTERQKQISILRRLLYSTSGPGYHMRLDVSHVELSQISTMQST